LQGLRGGTLKGYEAIRAALSGITKILYEFSEASKEEYGGHFEDHLKELAQLALAEMNALPEGSIPYGAQVKQALEVARNKTSDLLQLVRKYYLG